MNKNNGMNYRQASQLITRVLADLKIDNLTQERQLLLSELLDINSKKLVMQAERQLTTMQQELLQQGLQRRQAGEPVAYIIAQQGFWRDIFTVSPSVLIPRQESEILVEQTLRIIAQQQIASAFSQAAPREEGDDRYDVRTLLASLRGTS